LPAKVLVPQLRDYCDRFRELVTREIHRQAIKTIQPSGVTDWVNRIGDLENKSYFYYMSCPLSGEDIDRRHMVSLYLMRPDFRDAFERAAGSLAQSIEPVEELSELPLAGYFYQEVPVKFAESADGTIEVKHWSAGE